MPSKKIILAACALFLLAAPGFCALWSASVEAKDTGLNRVVYTATASSEPKVLFKTFDNIINPIISDLPRGPLVSWETEYLDRRETWYSISLDQGRTFSQAKEFAVDQYLPAPRIVPSRNNKLTYSFPGTDPFVCMVRVKDRVFEQLITSPGQGTYQFDLPSSLADGDYLLDMQIDNGLSISPAARDIKLSVKNILSPEKNARFKPGAAILVKVKADKGQKGAVMIDGWPLPDALDFDEEEGTLSGFILLPPLLSDGRHLSCVVLEDRSGKQVQRDFLINIASAPASAESSANNFPSSMNAPVDRPALITDFAQGPNPFRPARDSLAASAASAPGSVFTYSLSQPGDITIRVYNIIGTLIWTQRVPNVSSGAAAWSGTDPSGRFIGNGIYPFIFQAAAGRMVETRKGKIIVLQ